MPLAAIIRALNKIDEKVGLQQAENLMEEKNFRVKNAVAATLSASSDVKYNSYFKSVCDEATGNSRYSAVRNYGKYLNNMNDENTITDVADYLKTWAQNGNKKWLRYYAAEAIYNKRNELMKQRNDIISKGAEAKTTTQLSEKKIEQLIDKLENHLMKIQEKETDETILSYYKYFVGEH